MTRLKPRVCGAFALLVICASRQARAQSESNEAGATFSERVEYATRTGQFLPLTLAPNVGSHRALAAGFGGYDSAPRQPRVESFAEARVYGPFALRFGVQWRDANERVAPSITGRVQLLSQDKHGVDGGVAVSYKAEGFTEPRGEIEVALALARSFGSWRVGANLVYGQDAEGRERDGELRAAALCHLVSLYYLGIDGRARMDLGSEHGLDEGEHERSKYDFDVGTVLSSALGPVALGVHGGFSGHRRADEPTHLGFVAVAGLGIAL